MVDKKLKKYIRRSGSSDFDKLNQGDPLFRDTVYTIGRDGDVVKKPPIRTAEEFADYMIGLDEEQEPERDQKA